MDPGIKIGLILLITALIVVGGGYYYMTKNIPKK
jgi:hypothetical protein